MPTTSSTKANTNRRRPTTNKAPDAISLLKTDHRAVEALFKKYEQAGGRALKTKRRLVDQIIDALSVHAFIEEQVLYPAGKLEIPSAKDDVLEALEEHHVVKWQLQELIGLDPADERFEAKVTVLTEHVRHHVREEERQLFPLLRSSFDRARLLELGSELEDVKRVAPHHPHPRVPAAPAEHLLPEAVTSVIDRAKEAVKSVRAAT